MQDTEPTKFEFVDHTADAGFKVYGDSMKQLFEYAALALFSVITDVQHVQSSLTREIEIDAEDREALLVKWLSELNYLFFTEVELYCSFEITFIDEKKVRATLGGERFDNTRHSIHTEVKAVTYHHLYVREDSTGWEAQVILDL